MKKMFNMFKSRCFYLVLSLYVIIALIPTVSANATDDIDGGWAITKEYTLVYGYDGKQIGSLSANEGFTAFDKSTTNMRIEYSTPKGLKEGFLHNANNSNIDRNYLDKTCAAYVKTTFNVIYGPNANEYAMAGTVYAGEYVTVLGRDGYWAYVEYNTTAGRKRGCIPYSYLICHNEPNLDSAHLFYAIDELYPSHRVDLRSGPGTAYPIIGSIDQSDAGKAYITWNGEAGGHSYSIVRYTITATGELKTGYIIWN